MTPYSRILREIDDPDVTLLAVSKALSLEEMGALYRAGCRDFGENRLQTALSKRDHLPADIRWHFIGHLQTKKIPQIVGNFFLIHSVDSLPIAEKIDRVSKEKNCVTRILLQVNTSGEASKGGFSPETLREVYPDLHFLTHVSIEGLMTMAPLTDDEGVIRETFRRLRLLAEEFALPTLSMGMSNDYKIALEEGATLIRLGSALLPADE